jgi:hypothetical protein
MSFFARKRYDNIRKRMMTHSHASNIRTLLLATAALFAANQAQAETKAATTPSASSAAAPVTPATPAPELAQASGASGSAADPATTAPTAPPATSPSYPSSGASSPTPGSEISPMSPASGGVDPAMTPAETKAADAKSKKNAKKHKSPQ